MVECFEAVGDNILVVGLVNNLSDVGVEVCIRRDGVSVQQVPVWGLQTMVLKALIGLRDFCGAADAVLPVFLEALALFVANS